MNKSDTIAELTKALIKVQANLEGARKDQVNPFFKSRYADLASVWDAIRKPLADNGLAIVQTMDCEEEKSLIVETLLLHTSGEWICSSLAMPLIKPDPQAVGSAITYARRYALAAIVGVCPEDDDAEKAMGGREPEKQGHWCSEHHQVWFKKGAMKGYAHPIGDGWCNEPAQAPETPPGASQLQKQASQQPAERLVPTKVEGFDKGKAIYNIRQDFKEMGCTEQQWLSGHNYGFAALKDATEVQLAKIATTLATEYADPDAQENAAAQV